VVEGKNRAPPLDPNLDLDRLFYAQLFRVVRKDGTVRLDNQLYEVDLALRGLEVRLRFDPWTLARVEVDYRGQSFGLARRVDRGLNLPQSPAFALVLIGDEYLLSGLKLRNHRALHSRLACQVSLPPWSPSQCAQSLSAALQSAGLSSQSLEPAAVELLSSASGGLPRSLNLLARAAWIAAAMQGAQKINPVHVQEALESVPCVPGMLMSPPALQTPA
jgi:hypothetical protein